MEKSLAEVFAPGEYLSEELEARHWSQVEFAEILGRPTQFVSEIMSGKKEITRESAAQIGAALGTSAQFWLNLQNSYLLWKQSQDDNTQRQLTDVRRRARFNELAPIGVLRKRGLLRGESLDDIEASLLRLFELPTLEDEPIFAAAARRSNQDLPLTPTQHAWLAVARQQARTVRADTFDLDAVTALAKELAKTVKRAEAFGELASHFAAVGVRLVYVEAFPGSKMNGATFLLDDDIASPVIAISGRGRRLDKVLFTLLHELAHLVRGDVHPGEVLIDEESPESHTLGDENAANSLAAEWTIPGGLPPPTKPVRQQWVVDQAERIGVHPIVVIGQLQNRGELDWRTQLVKGAPTVTEELAKWNAAG